MITTPPTCFLPNHPKDCWIEVKSDLSNFVDTVNYYLKHNKEREMIAENGRKYFDKQLHPRAMCEYLIQKSLEYYKS